jgi:hypothetical protein
MLATVASAESDSQVAAVDPAASGVPYNNIPVGSRPTGFFYSVQVSYSKHFILF